MSHRIVHRRWISRSDWGGHREVECTRCGFTYDAVRPNAFWAEREGDLASAIPPDVMVPDCDELVVFRVQEG